jgi:hypothetical protein
MHLASAVDAATVCCRRDAQETAAPLRRKEDVAASVEVAGSVGVRIATEDVAVRGRGRCTVAEAELVGAAKVAEDVLCGLWVGACIP